MTNGEFLADLNAQEALHFGDPQRRRDRAARDQWGKRVLEKMTPVSYGSLAWWVIRQFREQEPR